MDDSVFSGRLLPGERILWSGRPAQGLLFTGRDAYLIPFSLAWCGFAVFWETAAGGGHAPGFFMLWGAMFIAVGLYFVAGRFLTDAWIRRGMAYAVTDRRALIARPRPFGSLTAVSLDRLADARLTEGSGGRGTIRFGPATTIFPGQAGGVWSPALDPTPQFLAIDDARSVFDLIQRSTTGRAAGRDGMGLAQ